MFRYTIRKEDHLLFEEAACKFQKNIRIQTVEDSKTFMTYIIEYAHEFLLIDLGIEFQKLRKKSDDKKLMESINKLINE
jgi:hypothetical protein